MKHWIWVLALVALLGCGTKPTTEAKESPSTEPTAQTGGSEGSGVAPTNPAVGGISPVTGSDGVAGGGSGVGQAAKDKAKQVGGGTSADRMPSDDQ
jgi:hypothetical protein